MIVSLPVNRQLAQQINFFGVHARQLLDRVNDRHQIGGLRADGHVLRLTLASAHRRAAAEVKCQRDKTGRRQRVGIVRALAINPDFIVCGEPVSALDVSIQAQVLNLLKQLQQKRNLTYMFVTHDLSVVRHISDDICVMYLGQVVELAPSKELFKAPMHPYTKALLSAIPSVDITRKMEREVLKGEITSPINPAPGCRFAARCKYATEACGQPQQLREVAPNHFVSCCRV